MSSCCINEEIDVIYVFASMPDEKLEKVVWSLIREISLELYFCEHERWNILMELSGILQKVQTGFCYFVCQHFIYHSKKPKKSLKQAQKTKLEEVEGGRADV